jgi:hypothetical protein
VTRDFRWSAGFGRFGRELAAEKGEKKPKMPVKRGFRLGHKSCKPSVSSDFLVAPRDGRLADGEAEGTYRAAKQKSFLAVVRKARIASGTP